MIAILVLYISISMVHGEDFRGFSKEVNVSNGTIVRLTNLDFRQDRGFIYATCNVEGTPGDKYMKRDTIPEIDCTLHLVTPSTPKHKCHVPFKATESLGIRDANFKPIGENKVIIESKELDESEKMRYHFRMVNLESCTIQRFDYPSGIPSDRYIGSNTYLDKFFVFVRGSAMCGDFDKCRITFDQNGKQVGEPVEIPNEFSEFEELPAMAKSIDQGHFIYGHSDPDSHKWKFIYIDPRGYKRVVANMSQPDLTSNARDLYGVCHSSSYGVGEGKLRCMQYDWKTDKKFNITLDGFFKDHDDLRFKTVSFANLGRGKFLFATVECKQNFVCNTFHATTVNSTGHIETSKSIPMNLNCYDDFSLGFYMGSRLSEVGDKFCFNFRCFKVASGIFNPAPFSFYGECISKSRI